MMTSYLRKSMIFKTSIESTFECSIERAFKTPMLCDITKVHTGFLFSPKVLYTTEDEDWGKIGSSKKVYVAKSLTQNGGFLFVDNILEREENQYWKIQIDNFQEWMFGFYKFIGEWQTKKVGHKEVLVTYSYSMFSKNPFLFPLNWIFVKVFWRFYMQRVVENIKTMAYNNEPYKFE